MFSDRGRRTCRRGWFRRRALPPWGKGRLHRLLSVSCGAWRQPGQPDVAARPPPAALQARFCPPFGTSPTHVLGPPAASGLLWARARVRPRLVGSHRPLQGADAMAGGGGPGSPSSAREAGPSGLRDLPAGPSVPNSCPIEPSVLLLAPPPCLRDPLTGISYPLPVPTGSQHLLPASVAPWCVRVWGLLSAPRLVSPWRRAPLTGRPCPAGASCFPELPLLRPWPWHEVVASEASR